VWRGSASHSAVTLCEVFQPRAGSRLLNLDVRFSERVGNGKWTHGVVSVRLVPYAPV
jgi:hypothetical protein